MRHALAKMRGISRVSLATSPLPQLTFRSDRLRPPIMQPSPLGIGAEVNA